MFWPIWIALTSAGLAVTWFTDRTAFYGFLTVLCGLLAMRMPTSFPPLFALTVWSVAAAIIISTNQSILAGLFAVLVALCYLPAVFGWPWLSAAFWSDVGGLCLLACLVLPTGLALVGPDRDWPRLLDSRPLPAWPMAAISHVAKTQSRATPKSLEWLE